MIVTMFHSVGNEKSTWSRKWLSCSITHFERFCSYLVNNGYQTLFMSEWYERQNKTYTLNGNEVLLTFDDGYLDNYVFVFPILKIHKLKATIFINPEFIESSDKIHHNLEDVWAEKIQITDLKTLGFLNWTELHLMDSSGIIDIQSHSMSHNFNFCSNKIIDIYNGQTKYDWLGWNFMPERKPFYINENHKDFIPVGYPVFEYGRALGIRKYFPDERIVDYAHELYNDKNLAQNPGKIITELSKKLTDFPGRFESDQEMKDRYWHELADSKSLIEKKLNKKVEYLCWPGGGYNELSIKLSIKAGYKASTLASKEKHKKIDNSGEYKRIKRIGISSCISAGSKREFANSPNHLIYLYKGKSGNSFYYFLHWYKKFKLMIKGLFK